MIMGVLIGLVLAIVLLMIFLKSKKTEVQSEEEKQEVVEEEKAEDTKEYPKANYKKFDHSRIITELGLDEEDAKDFIAELISQIQSTIPQIKDAIDKEDIKKLEELTHSIKGSATNLGSEGVASLLTDFNTYLKTNNDIDIIQRYFEHLEHYLEELKSQYT